MAQCIKCKREVGCKCNLTNGLCGVCASQEKENIETTHLEVEIKVENDSELHPS